MAYQSKINGYVYQDVRKERGYFRAANPKNRGFKKVKILEFLFPERRIEPSRKRHKEAVTKTLIAIGGELPKDVDLAIKEFEKSLKELNAKH